VENVLSWRRALWLTTITGNPLTVDLIAEPSAWDVSQPHKATCEVFRTSL